MYVSECFEKQIKCKNQEKTNNFFVKILVIIECQCNKLKSDILSKNNKSQSFYDISEKKIFKNVYIPENIE